MVALQPGAVPVSHLFDPGPGLEPTEKLSAQRKRTRRQRLLIDNGVHPLNGLPLHPSEKCGGCTHLISAFGGSRDYLKCALGPRTNGPGTDVRKWWPACEKWEPAL